MLKPVPSNCVCFTPQRKAQTINNIIKGIERKAPTSSGFRSNSIREVRNAV